MILVQKLYRSEIAKNNSFERHSHKRTFLDYGQHYRLEMHLGKMGFALFISGIKGFKLRVEGLTVLGEDVEIKNELFINGVIVMPHKTISGSIPEKNTIIM